MKYHVPQGEDYNKKASELYFIMGDDGVIYPARFELIHSDRYLKKIGAEDQNYYYFGGDYKYALAMNVEYKNSDESFYVIQHEIYFKSASKCKQTFNTLYFMGVTQDGGKILKIDYGMYDNFFDW